MGIRIDIAGASGQIYSFFQLDAEAFLRPIGVTYLIAERAEHGWCVLQVGETNNLAQRDWEPLLAAIRDAHPAAEMLIRLNVSRSIRDAEAADIAGAPSTKPASSGSDR
jgi:hypothetical protein